MLTAYSRRYALSLLAGLGSISSREAIAEGASDQKPYSTKLAGSAVGAWARANPPSCDLPSFFDRNAGDVDYAPALNRALAFLAKQGGGTVNVPNGDWVIESQIIILENARTSIAGPGCLVGGSIRVGTPFSRIKLNPSALDFDGSISCRMEAGSGRHPVAVQLSYVRGFDLTCHIIDYDVGISNITYPAGEVFGQMTARIRVVGAKFSNVANPVLLKRAEGGPILQHADWVISGNTMSGSRCIRNLDLDGVDGLISSSNFFFMAGSENKFLGKMQNVRLSNCVNFILSDNQYFEPGREAILLDRCQWGTVSGGVFMYIGQVFPSSCISIKGGDLLGGSNSNIYIGGFVGFSATKHVIEIGDNCGHITVGLFRFREPGSEERYYGGSPLPKEVSGVYVGLNAVEISADVSGVTASGGYVPMSIGGTTTKALKASW